MFLINQKLILSSALVILCIFNTSIYAQNDAERQAAEILLKNEEAIGGKEALAKIKTVETIVETEIISGYQSSGSLKGKEIRVEDKVSKRFYQLVESPLLGTLESGFDGKQIWVKSAYINSSRNQTDAETRARKLFRLPNENIDGKEYIVLTNTMEENKPRQKMFYDAQTYLLTRTESISESMGQQNKTVTTYSDYRKVNDRLVSFLKITERNVLDQTTVTKTTLVSIRDNIKISDSIFEFAGKREIDDTFANQTKSTNQTPLSEVKIQMTLDPREAEKWKQIEVSGLAPDFTASLIDGSTFNFGEFKGKVIVLNFWDTSCGICIAEMPMLNQLVKQYEGKDVEFIAITFDKIDKIKEFLTKHTFDFKHVVDAQKVFDLYKISGNPTNIIIDRQGNIFWGQKGGSDDIRERLIQNVEKALNQPNTK